MDSSNKLNIPKPHPSIVHLNHSGELTPERIDLLNLVAEAALKVMDENPPSPRKHLAEFTDKELIEMPRDQFDTPRNRGWLEQHPEEQVIISLEHEGTVYYSGPLFQELSVEEEIEFRAHARENYEPGMPIDEIFHPVWKDEARKMNKEIADASSKD